MKEFFELEIPKRLESHRHFFTKSYIKIYNFFHIQEGFEGLLLYPRNLRNAPVGVLVTTTAGD
jgi:hypothetical protein